MNPTLVEPPAIIHLPTPACMTQWNSTFTMLDHVINARLVIDEMCNCNDQSPWEEHKVSPEMQVLFNHYWDFLKDAYWCTAAVGGEY